MSAKVVGTHTGRIGIVAALIVACTFAPFLPGQYDPAALAFSFAAHAFGVVGLVLVPIGAAWFIYELRRRAALSAGRPVKDRGPAFALTALIVSSIVGAIACLSAAMESLGIGVALLILGAFGLLAGIRRLRRLRTSEGDRCLLAAPLYLIVIPALVALAQFMVGEGAVESSRNTAMRNASELIEEVERYKEVNGGYPDSMIALYPDYSTGVIGIPQYHYEPAGDAYNLSFEQFRFLPFGTREVVVYNPLDEHAAISHAAWRLTDADLTDPEMQGWYAAHDSPLPHWRYFWFD